MPETTYRPMSGDTLAYVLTFEPKVSLYGPPAAAACLQGLKVMEFSGIGEFYARDVLYPHLYLLGVALKPSAGQKKPTYEWWMEFIQKVSGVTARSEEVVLDTLMSELGRVRELRELSVQHCVVEFVEGVPEVVVEGEDSWFLSESWRVIAREAQRM